MYSLSICWRVIAAINATMSILTIRPMKLYLWACQHFRHSDHIIENILSHESSSDYTVSSLEWCRVVISGKSLDKGTKCTSFQWYQQKDVYLQFREVKFGYNNVATKGINYVDVYIKNTRILAYEYCQE